MADKEVTSTNGGIAIGGNVTNAQVVKGNQNKLTQQVNQTSTQGLSAAEVTGLLRQLQELVQASSLADDAKAKANRHIETARDELESDQAFAAKSVQKALEILQQGKVLAGSILEVWNKVKPFFGL